MHGTDYRFRIAVLADGSIVIDFGHAFTSDDVAALVAAESAARTAAGVTR